MVDQGEREDDIGVRPLEQGAALTTAPADPRARVGEVEDERQDVAAALAPDRAVVALGGSRIDVPGEHPLAGIGGDPAVATGIGAEVPGAGPGRLGHELADEAGLLGRRAVVVAGVVRVVRPFGATGLPRQAGDGVAQVADERDQP